MKLPGVYVEIRGDYSDLEKQMRAAKKLVSEQATGISNALNNALSPQKVKSGVDSIVSHFGTLNRASSVADQTFKSIGVNLKEFKALTGLTNSELAEFQSRLLKTQSANAQENALKRLATAAGLTRQEIMAMGNRFAMTEKQIVSVQNAVHGTEKAANSAGQAIDGAGRRGSKGMSLLGGGIAMAAGKFLLLEQAAYSVQRILNAVVFDFNSTVEVATLGIGSAFLTNGQYVDKMTGKVLSGQIAMNAAMEDADEVIQRLKASNLQTAATLEQLIKGYQETAPVALAKGFNKDQIEQFTVAMIQAAGVVDTTGMLLHQMGEETRSLLTGGINPKNTRIAVALGITNEDVRRYKSDSDGLFTFLMGKLSAYQLAGQRLQASWAGVASNTVDIMQQVAAEATEPIFISVRDGLKAVSDGFATIDKQTGKIKWSDSYVDGVESVKEKFQALVDFIGRHDGDFKDFFDDIKDGASDTGKLLGETVLHLEGLYAAGKFLGNWGISEWGIVGFALLKGGPQAAALTAALVTINKQLATMGLNVGALPGKAADSLKALRGLGTAIWDLGSGRRNWWTGDLNGVDENTKKLDRLRNSLSLLEEDRSRMIHDSFTAFMWGYDDKEQVKKIGKIKTAIKEIEDMVKSSSKSNAEYKPNTNALSAEEIDNLAKGRDTLKKYIQTEKEAILERYNSVVKFAQGSQEIAKAQAVRDKQLAALTKKTEKKDESLYLKQQREELKALKVAIALYADGVKASADVAMDWADKVSDSIDPIKNLNEELEAFGLGEFGKALLDSERNITASSKAMDVFSNSIAGSGVALKETYAEYYEAINKLEEFKKKLSKNKAGSSSEDEKALLGLKDKVEDLKAALDAQKESLYALDDAQGKFITNSEEMATAIREQASNEALVSAYNEIGLISKNTYEILVKREEDERDKFIELTGDKETAYRLYNERIKELDKQRRDALALDDFKTNGNVSGLMKNGLVDYGDDVQQEAVDFYKNVLPDAINTSSDAMAQFFMDVAEGNMTLKDAWKSLEKAFGDIANQIIKDIIAVSIRMAVVQSIAGISGFSFGGSTPSSSTGVTGYGNFESVHIGGTIGADALGPSVLTALSAFSGAKRYHTGLMGDEFPAILQKGESVLTKGQMAAIGAGVSRQSGPQINMTLIEAPGSKMETETKQNDDGSFDMIVRAVEGKLAGRMAQGKGLHQTMGSLYGVRRRV